MAKYRVTFTTYEEYEVDAANENEALNEAERELRADRSIPIADTHYDEKILRRSRIKHGRIYFGGL